MEKFYCYILFSRSHLRFYHGSSARPEDRLIEHNKGKVKSTKGYRPWEIVYMEEFSLHEEALQRELYFKTGAGRRFLSKIKEKILAEVGGSPPDR